MAGPGECVSTGAPLPYYFARPQVLKSAAGYYIGYLDSEKFPYSRESVEYFATEEEAITALREGTWTPRTTDYNG